MKPDPCKKLAAVHERLLGLAGTMSRAELRRQFHPDLSPAGWHLAHVAFVETYWLREIVLGDTAATDGGHAAFFPELIDKQRRAGLPMIDDTQKIAAAYAATERLYRELSSDECARHPLLENDYLGWFLVQHAEQHGETLHMILQQRGLAFRQQPQIDLLDESAAGEIALPDRSFAGGEYPVGTDAIGACDNEQPAHVVHLAGFRIASRPMSNAEYLGFMLDAGYQRRECWSKQGWVWKSNGGHVSPQHWRRDAAGGWYALTANGPAVLEPEAAVSGLSWYEADAVSRYAGCRLPHEHAWEVAMRRDDRLWQTTGEAWEWCSNTFYPYPGFRAFPYPRYSTPWFDGRHYVLRGGSRYSGQSVRHAAFRNFYTADKRHVFAGMRLARLL